MPSCQRPTEPEPSPWQLLQQALPDAPLSDLQNQYAGFKIQFFAWMQLDSTRIERYQLSWRTLTLANTESAYSIKQAVATALAVLP